MTKTFCDHCGAEMKEAKHHRGEFYVAVPFYVAVSTFKTPDRKECDLCDKCIQDVIGGHWTPRAMPREDV